MFDSICTLGFDAPQIEQLQALIDQAQMPPRLTFQPLVIGGKLPEALKSGRALFLWKVQSDSQAPTADVESTKWLLGVYRQKPPWLAVADPPCQRMQSICQAASAFGIFVPQPGEPEIIRNAILHLRLLSPSWNKRLTIPKILRLVHLSRGNIRLKIAVGEERRGILTVVDGELCEAKTREGAVGLEALREILTWPDGSISTVQPVDVELNISMPSRDLLEPEQFDKVLGRDRFAGVDHQSAAATATTITTDEACASVLENVAGALACWVVNLDTGILTGAQYMKSYFTQEYVDSVAATAVRTFRGRAAARIQQLLTPNPSGSSAGLKEAFFVTDQATQYMHPVDDKRSVVVLVTRKEHDDEASWGYLREALPAIRATLG